MSMVRDKEKRARVIFNYMPPAMPHLASPAFSVLKGFLGAHGYGSHIEYWNIAVFNQLMPFFKELGVQPRGTKDNLFMLPFLDDLSEVHDDLLAKTRIRTFLKSILPQRALVDGCEELLAELKKPIFDSIKSKLDTIDEKEILLFGFSSKFYQWIPGLFLAREIKKRFPAVKTAIGGFGRKEAARQFLRVSEHFDFALFGEGEYPMLALLNQLDAGADTFQDVSRLVWRKEGELVTNSSNSDYVQLDDDSQPDFSDIARLSHKGVKGWQFPLESSRGCHWNKCRFCSFNNGIKYRTRSPENTVREIERLHKALGITKFRFVDTDVVGEDTERFEAMLDAIIASAKKMNTRYEFYAEILPSRFNASIVEKLAAAGFNEVQIGYEAITDNLLERMKKKTDFADLLLFLKLAKRYGISVVGANIIRGIVGEKPEDVFESVENLAYLRFFLSRKPKGFRHTLSRLRLQEGSGFLKMVDTSKLGQWRFNSVAYLMPSSLTKDDMRFELFDYARPLEHQAEWEYFERINNFLETAEFNCRVIKKDGVPTIEEYIGKKLINTTLINKPEDWELLKAANDKCSSAEKIFEQLKNVDTEITVERVGEIIERLKKQRLLWANSELTRVVTLIETNPQSSRV